MSGQPLRRKLRTDVEDKTGDVSLCAWHSPGEVVPKFGDQRVCLGPHVIHGYVATNLYVCPMSQKPPYVSLVSRSPCSSPLFGPFLSTYSLSTRLRIYFMYTCTRTWVCARRRRSHETGPSAFKMATVSASVDRRCKLQAVLLHTRSSFGLLDGTSVVAAFKLDRMDLFD